MRTEREVDFQEVGSGNRNSGGKEVISGPMATVVASGGDGKEQGVETSVTYYRLEEVAKRNSSKDIWLVIHGRVYDVSRFLDEVGPRRWTALRGFGPRNAGRACGRGVRPSGGRGGVRKGTATLRDGVWWGGGGSLGLRAFLPLLSSGAFDNMLLSHVERLLFAWLNFGVTGITILQSLSFSPNSLESFEPRSESAKSLLIFFHCAF